ncbi:preATP grasp domain-containing protein [Streptomonospora litoralis]|uniref:[Butirosin acyl-carrier protein]--L-glutamate ligase n=1 Tax=Streptomonospora litoralis TaxID=2498135 RepID=A0A4P6Q0B8_9ACTN|nr:ATP-grasp domain-containing protein [Streptomonospora litoralis]QBI52621.1 [Butirosin acyl-carrier protein]--L-glutamate ligase [Streptomonospora litoralis]
MAQTVFGESAEPPRGFVARLKHAVAGPGTGLVFLGNFEVEEEWAHGEVGLPKIAVAKGRAVVNRMEEFALLLAGAQDCVVLKAEPDSGYLAYLEQLGAELPERIVVADQAPDRTVTEDALADPGVLDRLTELAGRGRLLLPHGVSTREEDLAAKVGMRLAAPGAAICKHVNSKVYSRLAAEAVGLRQAAGWVCRTPAEFRAAAEEARPLLRAGGKVVVKDAYGVSGKGLAVVESDKRLALIARKVAAAADRAGTDRVALVVEEWVAKDTDLNYQFTVAGDGSVHFDFVKEAITDHGVHKGHRMPARLTAEQRAELRSAAELLGRRLHADGYRGVVGVDAMTDPRGGVYPVVEINARNNMSTYQTVLQERYLGEGRVALARQYPLELRRPLPFERLAEALGDRLLRARGDSGLLVNNFATVNAGAAGSGELFEGRLYGLLVADSQAELEEADARIAARLADLAAGVRQ